MKIEELFKAQLVRLGMPFGKEINISQLESIQNEMKTYGIHGSLALPKALHKPGYLVRIENVRLKACRSSWGSDYVAFQLNGTIINSSRKEYKFMSVIDEYKADGVDLRP